MPDARASESIVSCTGMDIKMGWLWYGGLFGLFSTPFLILILERALHGTTLVVVFVAGVSFIVVFLGIILSNVRHVHWLASNESITEKRKAVILLQWLISENSETVSWSKIQSVSIGKVLLAGLIITPAIKMLGHKGQRLSLAAPDAQLLSVYETMASFCRDQVKKHSSSSIEVPISFLNRRSGKIFIIAYSLILASFFVVSFLYPYYEAMPVLAIGALILSRMIKIATL